MKKLAIIVCMVSVMLFGTLPASADNTVAGEEAAVNRMYYQCDTAEAFGGDILEYTISLKNADQLVKIQCTAVFDSTELEYIGIEFSQIINDYADVKDINTKNNNRYGISVCLNNALSGDYEVVTLKFKIKNEVVCENIKFELDKIKLGTENNKLEYNTDETICTPPVKICENYKVNNFSANNGTVSGIVTAKTAQKNAKMLVCSYADNRFIGIDSMDLSEISDGNFKLKYNNEADTVKLIFVDSFFGIEPLETVKTYIL